MDLTKDIMKCNSVPKEIPNPLLKNNMELNLDTGVVKLNSYNIPKFFRRAYVLTPFKNESFMEQLNSQKIDSSLWDTLGRKMVLHETNIKIIGNFTHNHNIVIGKSSDFQEFNHFDYQLTDNILIIPILNISYLNITKYLQIFEGNNNLIDFYKVMVVKQLFSINDELTYNNKLNITEMISNLEESKYWTKKYNCLFNITNLFYSRRLRFSNLDRVSDPETKKIIMDIVTKDQVDANYLQNIKGSKQFVDAASSIIKRGFKLYRLGKESEISKHDMTIIFSKLNDSQKFYMFCNLIISKKYCHLAINNYEIMKKMQSSVEYFARLFKYLIGYSWIRFYMEEGIKKTWMTNKDEFIFDINTASLLPVYPFSMDDPKSNPYMPILVDDKVLNSKDNLGGLKWYNNVDPNFTNQGITDLNGFKKRMNLFITGNSSNDIFMNMNWDQVGAGISGSIMAACLQKRHPLVSLFTGKNNFNQYSSFDMDYNRYFNEYYAEADVDIMIKSSHPIDFMDKAKNVFNQVVVNICGFNPQNAEPEHIRMKTIKTVFLFVDENFIKTNIVDNKLTFEYIITNLSNPDVIEKFMPFIAIKTQEFYDEKFSEYKLDDLKIKHPELFDDNETFYQIHLSKPKVKKEQSESEVIEEHIGEECEDDNDEDNTNFDEETFEMPNVGINISYKVKISSIHMQRQLELFSLFGDDFFTLVSKFHMPCVRAYYDGENVYLTPSCISAHMTYMNIDYKYFAGSKDPIEIILKYRMRGFGTFLNKNELNRTVKYVSKVQFWNNLHNVNLDNKNSVNNFFGSVALNNKLFQPRIYNQELFDPNIPFVNLVDGYNNIPSLEPLTYKTHESFMNYFFKSYEQKDFPNIRYINSKGYVVPVKKWLIESVFNMAKYQYLNIFKDESKNKIISKDNEPKKILKPLELSQEYNNWEEEMISQG